MEAKFASMRAEWDDVIRDQARGKVTRWELRFAELAAEEMRLRDAGCWLHGREDLMGILGEERDELAHSRMVAWLLDPCGRHGLGTRVLAGVLGVSGSPSGITGLERARTQREVPLGYGRVDIMVECPGLVIVIENKIDAEEGQGQCESYSKDLPAEAVCILLSPDGRKPQGETSFLPLRYADLAEIIRRALRASTNQGAGRKVVEDYLVTLEAEFRDVR